MKRLSTVRLSSSSVSFTNVVYARLFRSLDVVVVGFVLLCGFFIVGFVLLIWLFVDGGFVLLCDCWS